MNSPCYVEIILVLSLWILSGILSILLNHLPGILCSLYSSAESWWVRISAQHFIITKDDRNVLYCYQVRCVTLFVRVGEMHFLKTTVAHCKITAELGLSDEGRAIKEFVASWVLLNLIPRVFGQKKRNGSPYLSLCIGPDVSVSRTAPLPFCGRW